MMKQIQEMFSPKTLLEGNFGIEREGLRCDEKGQLVHTPHPEIFGEKLQNPYITTDFSESQVELITPVFKTTEETYKFLEALYDITALEIEDEYIWPQSMPCSIPDDQEIPIATFQEDVVGQEAYAYRKKLMKKYGGKKQLLSGIHYNFSFDEKLIQKLYNRAETDKSYRVYRDELYLKVARNYLRYRWLLIYLLGSTSVIHESYIEECVKKLKEVGEAGYSNKGALSYRNSECGYANKTELFPDYSSVDAYMTSIEQFVSDGLIDGPKELYSQIRLKAYDNTQFMDSLKEKGIAYLEYRSIDINPFDKAGIALSDMYFMNLFNLFLLFKEETTYDKWQEEALANQRSIAVFGQKDIVLLRDGEEITKEAWGLQILAEIQDINHNLKLGKEDILEDRVEKIKNYKLTYAYQIMKKVKTEGYIQAHLNLATAYRKEAFEKRYKLVGYEDLELSTQLVLKEAIKRGIQFEMLDRSENFIRLEKNNNVQHVMQATKTSKDNYVTILMMENKIVTKDILHRAGIVVPIGGYFDSLEEAEDGIDEYINKPIVVKPKSTNFGLGISIFPEGANREDIRKAVAIAFQHDKTILVESFVQGKEYRFMVIDDKVVGILHRVPANVKGDGVHTIEELVETKNLDPLRGKGYKTPLEKIVLDESAQLFLKQSGLTVTSVPQKDEIVYLRENSNISTGGDSIDYTDLIPQTYKDIAIQSARAVDATICGVDMMLPDYTNPDGDYAIIELNFNPAIHIHCYPYEGTERKVAADVLNVLGY